jgi:AmmeMemoRadiSam system protein B
LISSDFSHYLSYEETKKADEKTLQTIYSWNSEEILNLENPSQSDCPLCLWFLTEEVKKFVEYKPILLGHTNSAELLNEYKNSELTSHFCFSF